MTTVPLSGDGTARIVAEPLNPATDFDPRYIPWILFFLATSMAVLKVFDTLPQRVAWLAADLTAVALFFRYQSQFINLALGNVIFVSWGLIACVSALWSVAPGHSLYLGAQLVMTILIAFLLCIQFRLQQIVEIIFFAMLLSALIAVATVILWPPLGIDPVGNWRGGFPHKNVMGDAMVMLIVSASCLFLQGRWRLLTATSIALGFGLILLTRAATPLLSVMMTLSPLPFAYALLRGRSQFFSLLGIALLVAIFVGSSLYLAMSFMGFDPIEAVLEWVGKGPTLTGRTILWEMAGRAIEEKPWLGYGFDAYWVRPPAEMIDVYYAFGQQIHHFHNNFLEMAVAYGPTGPILLVAGLLVAGARSIRRAFHARNPIEIWPLLIIIQITIQAPVQVPLMYNHSMWLVAFIAAAAARR